MFATDRDLLVLEPYLFRDHAWVGQRLARGIGSITDNVLSFSTVDVELDLAQVAAGCVVTVLGTSYEITGGVASASAQVSRLRSSATGTNIAVADTTGADAWIVSFRPQIAMVHRQILRMAGIEPDAPAPIGGRLGASAITNGNALVTLESLGALHLIFAAAASIAGPGSPAATRASMYRDLFREERLRAEVELDSDGDGLPDVVRRLNVARLVRA
jgi:hypothetical protein